MDIEILLWFQTLRNAFFDGLFSCLSFLGTDFFAFLLIALVYWCINKKTGRLMSFNLYFVGLINSVVSTLAGMGGPWLKDTRLNPVKTVDKYSQQVFTYACPKTSNAGATFGTFAFFGIKNTLFRIICLVLLLTVPISQMYMGIEAPQDVMLALGISLIVIIITSIVVIYLDLHPKADLIIMFVSVALAICAGLFVFLYTYDVTETGASQGISPHIINSISRLFAFAVFAICWIWEKRRIRFETKAKWYVQAIKFIIGGTVIFVLIYLIKSPLDAIFTAAFCNGYLGQLCSGVIRYGLVSFFITALYPIIFTAVLKNHLVKLPHYSKESIGNTFLPTTVKNFTDDKANESSESNKEYLNTDFIETKSTDENQKEIDTVAEDTAVDGTTESQKEINTVAEDTEVDGTTESQKEIDTVAEDTEVDGITESQKEIDNKDQQENTLYVGKRFAEEPKILDTNNTESINEKQIEKKVNNIVDEIIKAKTDKEKNETF